MTPLFIGLILLALLALVVVAASFRKRDTSNAIGQLSGETVKRDRSPVAVGAMDADEGSATTSGAVTGSAVEAAARAERSGSVVPATEKPPVVYIPPDPETIGVNRRQFLNRAIIGAFGFALLAFGGAVLAQLWPKPQEGFGAKLNVGRIPDIKASIQAAGGFFLLSRGSHVADRIPGHGSGKGSKFLQLLPPGRRGSASRRRCPVSDVSAPWLQSS